MAKITFMGAGSTVFARNVLGDCMCSPVLSESEIALYDIDGGRLKDSEIILSAINKNVNGGKATIKTYLGVENRKEALRGADFVVNAIQVGLYDPCTIIDFEVPKKYGLRQTISDTLGIGGIMRGLRTIPVLRDFAADMEEVCPNAWFLNYTNPMSILTGYMQRYTNVKTVGLCHSVQVCSEMLMKAVGMEDKLPGRRETIAGINHMAWLLELYDSHGNDIYPEVKRRAICLLEANISGDLQKMINDGEIKDSQMFAFKDGRFLDAVRTEYIRRLGYYCTESSEHNAEYNPFFIKAKYPELIERYNIPLDEYPRRCVNQIAGWEKERDEILADGKITHERSHEYASHIMEAVVTGEPYKIGGNVLNAGCIDNLPADACVEVPCLVDGMGIHPTHVGRLPVQLAAMNMTNVNVQLMTIEAAVTKNREDIYRAAMLDPHTAAELSIDDIVSMCDELIEAHGVFMKDYK